MFGSFGKVKEKAVDYVEGKTFETTLRGLSEASKQGWEGVPHMIPLIEKYLNIEFEYEQAGSLEFAEMRERLRTEPGVIIANHPGTFDVPIMLKAAFRRDLLLWASEHGTKVADTLIGRDHILQVERTARGNLAQFRQIEKHIHGGGALMFYPTGGDDGLTFQGDGTTEFEFKHGFSALLRRVLRPTDMVYSFYIDPYDTMSILGERVNRVVGAASGFSLTELLNINRLKEKKKIQVREKYSTAAEWQRSGIVRNTCIVR